MPAVAALMHSIALQKPTNSYINKRPVSHTYCKKMTSYTEDEEEEDAYKLRRRGLQLATSTDCIRIDEN